jgi:hypothetical protein
LIIVLPPNVFSMIVLWAFRMAPSCILSTIFGGKYASSSNLKSIGNGPLVSFLGGEVVHVPMPRGVISVGVGGIGTRAVVFLL